MQIKSLTLENFRQFEQLKLNFSPFTLIRGNNATGKTTVLEAIYFGLCGRSFREHLLSRLKGPFSDSLFGELEIDDGVVRYQVEKGRKFSLNGKKIGKLSHFYALFPVVYFGRDSLDLLRFGPGLRRGFLDGSYSKGEVNHLYQCQQLKKIVHMKNSFLRDPYSHRGDSGYLDSLNQKMADLATVVVMGRLRFLREIEAEIDTLLGEKIYQLTYSSRFPLKKEAISSAAYYEYLSTVKEKEVRRRQVLAGPHRDDFEMILDDRSVRYFASTGQKKKAVLVLKHAYARWLESCLGQSPVWLLDDVIADLDMVNLAHMASFLKPESQIILSLLPHQEKDEFLNLFPAKRSLWKKYTLSKGVGR